MKKPLNALLSNDDGYLAEGIVQLNQICQKHFKSITVVAPDRNCSGASGFITLRHPLYTHTHTNGFISVEGKPTDCVNLALSGLLDKKFDIVISGINLGANLGDDIVYSGTVAAAIEGRFLGYPAIAVSITAPNPRHYETAEYVIDKVIEKLIRSPLPSDIILNINIPDIPLSELKGIKSTRIGFRGKSEPINERIDEHGQSSYYIGPVGKVRDDSEGTDFYAIKNQYASITPLHIDLTKHSLIGTLEQWINE